MRLHYKDKQRSYGDMSYEGKYLLDPKYMTKRDMQHYYRYFKVNKSRGQFKKVVVIVFSICVFSYIFIDYNLKTKIIKLRDRFDFMPNTYTEYNSTQAYFVNTPGCQMPFFNVTDDNIIQFIDKPRNYTCKKALTRTSDTGTIILLNMNALELQKHYQITDLNQIDCYYTEIKRKDDDENIYLENVAFKLDYNKPVKVEKPGIEFIRVKCFKAESPPQLLYKDFHFFIVDKTDTKLGEAPNNVRSTTVSSPHSKITVSSKDASKESSQQSAPATNISERVSVMILGIDSLSHLNFLRQMPKTASLIRRNLSHVEFWGYNKLGDNTYPNSIPFLTGLDESELNISCLAPFKNQNYDKCTLIFKRYKEAGFKTVFAEDVSHISLFNFYHPGFNRQPTDYYMRPIMLEMRKHISYMKYYNVDLCKGGRRTVEVLLEYIRKLIPYLQTQDFFSFFWSITLSHDFFNMPQLLDPYLLNLLTLFDISGVLNKTVIFFMSDHGLRFGSFRKTYQGMVEDRQPLFMVLYPKWFKDKYAAAVNNLEINAKRLTTHFDLHATMLDLLDLTNIETARLLERSNELRTETDTLPRGISLFLPVPDTRTCENAGISTHWCMCHRHQELPTNDVRVRQAARFIVKLINDRLKSHPQCRTLYLNSILDAIVAAPHPKLVQNVTNDYSIDITVQVQTKPGLAIFESTARMAGANIVLTGAISRLNMYGSQSYCINESALKMFCYCHR